MNYSIYRHWLPRVTICPVNGLPDLIYVSVCMDKQIDLYSVRKTIASVARHWRKAFMEQIADDVLRRFPDAIYVEVRLAFSRHVVRREPKK